MTKWTSEGKTTRLPSSFCPRCFQMLNAATSLVGKDATPEPGDFTVCITCAAVLRFDTKLALELSSLDAIPVHLRMAFAKVVRTAETLFGDRWNRKAKQGRTVN